MNAKSLFSLLASFPKTKIKTKEYALEAKGQTISLFSFSCHDTFYKQSKVPTHARGLFIAHDALVNSYNIVIRGYNKFFNSNYPFLIITPLIY